MKSITTILMMVAGSISMAGHKSNGQDYSPQSSRPNVFGGHNYSNGVVSQPNVFGGRNYSNGVVSQPNVFGGQNYSNGAKTQPNAFGGQTYVNPFARP